jgi:hypothetical protein
MKRVNRTIEFLVCIAFSFVTSIVSAQDTTGELDRRNGFKDLKLGTPIDSIRGAEFKKDVKEKNEFPAKLYEVENDNYKHIGEVKVKSVEVKTYKDFIYEIVIITHKDTRLMKGMMRTFGQPKYILTSDTYNWVGETLSLTFKDHSRNEIKLTYRSFALIKMMFADKGKKIDEIAEDF